MAMQDLLFLAHRMPFPPDKGDKIRSWHLLRHLAKRYRVHLGAFIDRPEDRRHVPILQVICASTHFEVLNPRTARMRAARGFFKGEALSFPFYRHAGMRAWVAEIMQNEQPEIGFAFSSQVAPYLTQAGGSDMLRVFDFVDVDSDKWRQYAARQSFPMSWVYRREASLLAAAEARLASEADVTLFVSEPEASLFRARTGLSDERVISIGNGVDLGQFDPANPVANPYGHRNPSGRMVFTGAMDYWANADAVSWFAKEILPLVRQGRPEAEFYICGANPLPEVRALASEPGVVVTGRVEDIRGYVRYADVCVAPLQIARGIQNKILEAMASARPVVCTPQAFEGIDAEPKRDICVAAGAEDFAAQVLALLSDPVRAAQVGQAARKAVERRYAWPAQMAALDHLLDRGAGAGGQSRQARGAAA